MVHELTVALRASLPLLLRQRHGRQWHQVVRAQRLQNLDFSAALDVVRDAKLLPAESSVSLQRCHEFRNQLAHQARLSKLRWERGQGVLRDLASALGLPIRAAVAPPPPHLVRRHRIRPLRPQHWPRLPRRRCCRHRSLS